MRTKKPIYVDDGANSAENGPLQGLSSCLAHFWIPNSQALIPLIQATFQFSSVQFPGPDTPNPGNMCDEGDARSVMDREVLRQHKSMLIDLDGAMWALVRTAVECGPDVALQACRAIATVR